MVFGSLFAIRFEMPTTGAPVTWNAIGKSTCFPRIRQNRAIDVRDDVGPAVPDVHGAARVREGYVDVEFFQTGRVGLKGMGPLFVRFFLKSAQIEFAHVTSPSGIPVYTGLSLMISLFV